MTNTVGNSIPHVRHDFDIEYGSAVTEVTLQKDGGSPVSYTVSASQVQSTPADIVLFGHGVYSATGTYVWTIKATGYEDTTVTVNVVNPS